MVDDELAVVVFDTNASGKCRSSEVRSNKIRAVT